MGHFLGGANVVGANVTGASVASCGANVVGAIVGGASVGGAIVGGATVGGATVGGAPVGGAFDVGANVAEQMSRSNCRVLRSKCRRSNRRRSMCHGTDDEPQSILSFWNKILDLAHAAIIINL